MPGTPTNGLLGSVCRLVFRSEATGLTDGQLLEAYVADRSEAAFEALVRRHGPMVLGVCLRVLGRMQDAEDAFQATFFVLARKAASIRPGGKVSAFLHGVAFRAALKTRALVVRQRAREKQVRTMPEPSTVAEGLWHELEPLLDQEVSRLPDRYRLPVVLCDLEGKTRKEAARLLGWPEGTVAGRIARARALLAKRLAGHGLTLSGTALAVVLAQNTASAMMPASLVSLAARAATGTVSAPVAAITKGVMKAMLLTKLKIGTAVVLVAALLGFGTRFLPHRVQAAGPKATVAEKRPLTDGDRKEKAASATLLVKNAALEKVDVPRRAVSLTIPDTLANVHWNPGPAAVRKAEGDAVAEIAVKQAKLDQAEANLKRQEADIALREEQVARFTKLFANGAIDQKVLAGAKTDLVKSRVDRVVAKAVVEASERELSSAKALAKRLRSTRLEGLPMAKDARITIRDKKARLTDLKPGMHVAVQLGMEGNRLVAVRIAARD